MPKSKRQRFSSTRAIIAEGEEDAAVARALLASYATDTPPLSPFDVSPVIDIGDTPGNTGFKDAVSVADALDGFPAVTDVVIVADNDADPGASFRRIVEQIEAAKAEGLSRNWAIPIVPCVKAVGDPSVSVWLWPADAQNGCLETLLWELVRSETRYKSIVACVDQAIQCAGISDWPLSKLDKARIRCFIALCHRRSPAVALARVWTLYPDLIRIRSRQFTPFLQFLRTI